MADNKPARQGYNTRRRDMKIRYKKAPRPLPNYTLSTVCPQCGADTFKLACKVRCARCGFMWDCSEL
jgi:hypothetical protein